jgi:hypothetical protein
MRTSRPMRLFTRSSAMAGAVAMSVCTLPAAGASPDPQPRFTRAVAFDVSRPAREVSTRATPSVPSLRAADPEPLEIRPEYELVEIVGDTDFTGDGALDGGAARSSIGAPSIPGPLSQFEGISNQDNFNIHGGRVNPPDPVGDVGPHHYVEMVNLAFAVYDKQGASLVPPTAIGALWEGFAVEDCTDPSGDPIVVYDQLEDRWILSQFTTRGLAAAVPFYNCVAVSQTGDPTGAYFRYAFITQQDDEVPDCWFFPDYPKYGVWTHSYVLTTRDFGCIERYGISVYALEKRKMIAGDPNARAVQFFLELGPVPLHLIGDGLLPPDIDGHRRPRNDDAAPIVGTMDDGGGYGAPFDGINLFDLKVKWRATPVASLELAAQLPVAEFDSIFPCAPTARDCLPQPGITDPQQYLDVLSYRQRPMHRLAYRNFGGHESLVTNQAVEARPATAGVRWYEIRRSGSKNPVYSVHQQGTFAPPDGVHRWMGSAAMDRNGNLAVGYSVVNDTTVFPGIRYAGRLATDPLGDLSLGEATVIDGSGVQTTTNSRWGDYTSMNIDPTDDCTFWYVNEYYTAEGQASSPAGWQTRIASFKLPGCASPR